MATSANQRRIVDRSSESENYLVSKPVERSSERSRKGLSQKKGLGYRDPNKDVAPSAKKSIGDDVKPGRSYADEAAKDKYSDPNPKEEPKASSAKVEISSNFQNDDESDDEVSHANCGMSWAEWEWIELPAWKRPSCTVPIRNPLTKGKIPQIPRPPPDEQKEEAILMRTHADVFEQQNEFRTEREEEDRLFGQHLEELIAELRANNQDGGLFG